MRNIYIYTSMLSFVFCISVFAQEKQLAKAEKEFKQLSYIDARETYLKVAANGYTSQDIYEKLGDSYYFNAQLEEASLWYGKLYEEYSGSTSPEYLFRYSQTLKSMELYKESDAVMLAFDKVSGFSESRAKLFQQERNYLDLIALQSGKFKINNLLINSSNSDFGPSFLQDEMLVFASSRDNRNSRIVHDWNEKPFLDLYTTFRQGKSSMGVEGLERLKGSANTRLHESSTVFTEDGRTMYFTRNNYTNKKEGKSTDGTILLKLYKATKSTDGKWKNIKELPFNSNEYSVAHPALSKDEKKLYFASDMPGTKGLSDLYVVNITGENTYSEPRNLGSTINTEARETFPFISKSGSLYFASDGHVGLGGLDVFISNPKGSKDFKEPYNVGTPVNSPDDDFTFIVDEESRIGFFTSNRAGGKGDDDIYSFIQTADLITSCNQYLSGIVTDAETRQILPGAKVMLYNAENMKELASTIADTEAKYKLPVNCDEKYVIRAAKENYKSTEVNFVTDNVFEFKHNQPIQLSKGGELGIVEAKIGDDLGKLLQLNPIYFDLDKSFIRPDAEIELQKIIAVLREYPNMILDVRSHTDSRQTHEYNMRLSDRRAKSTIAYIVDKGNVSKNRLSGRGYGEVVLTNECVDGVDCSEEKHQLNRRSEFIILKQ